jgi:hypothetical protein
LVNKGNITFDGENTRNYVSIGGIFGSFGSKVAAPDFSGNLVNTGNFTFSGKAKTYLRIGGIISVHSGPTIPVPMINTGDITVTGTCDLTSASTQIGGITAAQANPIKNAQYYGDIKAIGFKGKLGLISGKAYAETLTISDSAVGGTVTYDEIEDNDPSGDVLMLPNVQTVDTSNYYKFLYGTEVEESIATSNNVTVLTSAPSTEQPAPEPAPEETPEA